MAIFRARGGKSFITFPPMNNSPSVGVSKPAIMRSSVLLPQPEGPSSTRNSPSRVSRLTPFTATMSPNVFLMPRVSTVAIALTIFLWATGCRLVYELYQRKGDTNCGVSLAD
jgi:hypothetical protein